MPIRPGSVKIRTSPVCHLDPSSLTIRRGTILDPVDDTNASGLVRPGYVISNLRNSHVDVIRDLCHDCSFGLENYYSQFYKYICIRPDVVSWVHSASSS